jgi:hypothetical protein
MPPRMAELRQQIKTISVEDEGSELSESYSASIS